MDDTVHEELTEEQAEPGETGASETFDEPGSEDFPYFMDVF